MSAFDTYRQMRDSTLQNNRLAEQDLLREQDRNALRLAGTQYATGDATGARNALLSNGMIDEGVALGRYDQQAQRQGRLDRTQDMDRYLGFVVNGADALRRTPLDQRWQVYQSRVLPTLTQLGVPAQIIQGISEADMADSALDSVIALAGGEPAKAETFNTRTGVIERDPYTGDYKVGYAVAPDPLEQELTRARIAATNAQVGQRQASASAASARAQRTRSGGSGRGRSGATAASAPAGMPSLPPGFRVR